MSEITTAAELDALPVGSVVLDDSGIALRKTSYLGWCADTGDRNVQAAILAQFDPRVIYRPDLPQNGPQDATGGEKATRGGSDGEWGLKSAHSASVVERLDEIRAREQAATDGPWRYAPGDNGPDEWADVPDVEVAGRSILDGLDAPNAEFIAHAREDVPWLLAAVDAVLGLHRRSHAVFSWATCSTRFEDPCPECDGKAGVHPCGCWADVDIEYVCSECKEGTMGASVSWPCPTVRAIAEAVGS